MAQIHNALHRATELVRGVRTIFGFGASEGGLERLGETLTPVCDLWAVPEWAVPRGERIFAANNSSGAIVGEYTAQALVNASSNLLLVIERCAFAGTSAAGQLADFGWATQAAIVATLGVLGVGTRRDLRGLGTSQLLYSGSDAGTAFYTRIERRYSTAQNSPTDFLIGVPFILRPGDACVVVNQTVNQGINVSWAWRERSAFAGELSV